jgi:hypothetical protein
MGFFVNLLVIELIVFGGLTLFGAIVGLVQRNSELVVDDIVINRISPGRAAVLVGQFLESVEDYRFGFPTGRFFCEKIEQNEVVADEARAGTVGTSLIKVFALIPLQLGAVIADFGCCIGAIIGFFLGVWLDLFLLPGIIIATIAESVLKRVLRSKVIVDITPGIDESVHLRFRLLGPSARLLRASISEAFHPAVVPSRIASLAGLTAAPSVSQAPITAAGPAGSAPSASSQFPPPAPGGDQ